MVTTCCVKLGSFLRKVTVEPVLFLYMLATFSQYAIFQDLVYSKVCLAKYNATICADLHSNSSSTDSDILDFVQKSCSHWLLLATLCTAIPSIFISVYLGSWSDRFGRKWPVAIPPLGGVLGSLVYVVISFEPSAPIYWICFASFLPGMTGGFVSCIMSCMTYVSAITSDGDRTMRVSRLEAMIFLGGTIGPFVSGSLLAYMGHGYAFAFMMFCYLIAFLYAATCVTDVEGSPGEQVFSRGQDEIRTDSNEFSSEERQNMRASRRRESPSKISHSSETEEETRDFLHNASPDRKESCCVKYFGSKHFFEAVYTCCKRRDENRQLYILMIILAGFITMMMTAGELDVAYLFARDKPLMWSPQVYSYYFGFKYGMGAFVLLVGMPIFQKLKLADATVCMIGLISRIAGLVCYGLSTSTTMAFFGPLAAIFSFFTIPSLRALLSKLVLPSEQGKMFSFVAIIEDLCLLSASVLFNSIYPITRTLFHGFIFQLAAVILLIPLTIFWYIWRNLPIAILSQQVGTAAEEKSRDTAELSES